MALTRGHRALAPAPGWPRPSATGSGCWPRATSCRGTGKRAAPARGLRRRVGLVGAETRGFVLPGPLGAGAALAGQPCARPGTVHHAEPGALAPEAGGARGPEASQGWGALSGSHGRAPWPRPAVYSPGWTRSQGPCAVETKGRGVRVSPHGADGAETSMGPSLPLPPCSHHHPVGLADGSCPMLPFFWRLLHLRPGAGV